MAKGFGKEQNEKSSYEEQKHRLLQKSHEYSSVILAFAWRNYIQSGSGAVIFSEIEDGVEIAYIQKKRITDSKDLKVIESNNPHLAAVIVLKFENGDYLVTTLFGPKTPPEYHEELPEDLKTYQYVYFIQRGNSGPVKVGVAKDPKHRLKQLQTGNAEELKLLGTIPGGTELEQILHERFSRDRMKGEWFHPNADILNFVLNYGSYTYCGKYLNDEQTVEKTVELMNSTISSSTIDSVKFISCLVGMERRLCIRALEKLAELLVTQPNKIDLIKEILFEAAFGVNSGNLFSEFSRAVKQFNSGNK